MKKRGIGMAAIFYGTGYGNGFPDTSTAFVEINDDGSANVLVGAVDVGQGSDNLFAQIAAEELGIDLTEVTVVSADTDCTTDAGTTAATRQTYTTGNAVREAARKARELLWQRAAKELQVTVEGLEAGAGRIFVKGFPDRSVAIAQICSQARLEGQRFLGVGKSMAHTVQMDPETGQGIPYWPYAFATQIAEVEVDTETGVVEVLRITAAHDVGKALNRQQVEGQIEGGVVQGVGYALLEEVELGGGKIKNPAMSAYLIPTMLDAPEIETIIVEDPEPTGPYGAKGVGEPALIPTAPAILNAIYDAIGVRITNLPATPEKILAGLWNK